MNEDSERINNDVLRTGREHWTLVSCLNCGSTALAHISSETVYMSTGQRREYKHIRHEFECIKCGQPVVRHYQIKE